MRKLLSLSILFSFLGFLLSCENDTETEYLTPSNEVSKDVIAKLNAAGFNTTDFPVHYYNGQIIVENDILLTEEELNNMSEVGIAPLDNHYHTTNLVTGTPRTIKVYVSSSFNSNYPNATDDAIARYNAENLNLTFQRVTSSSGADIKINPSPWWYGWFGILGSAGFPTASGDPHNEILMTRSYYDNVSDLGALTTTIAHEMGHCIGFRHTDYMDRSYSCGGSTNDEGDGGVGANHIPGTPTGPDALSWMLACSDGSDRPFTSNDKTALDYLY